MTVRKRFDKALYEEADRKAKKHMVEWLMSRDHAPVDLNTNETTYFDIISTVDKDLPRHLYEVEMKYAWKGEWPDSWKEICYNDLLTFVILKNDCTQAWHIDGETVLNSEVKEASNRVIRKGELFFHIPVTDAYLVDMEYESNS